MLKFVIPQPGSATITLHQTGDSRPLVFGQPQHLAGIVGQALSLQDAILNKPLNANGAYDLSMFQPGLEWYDLAVDDGHLTDNFREEFAVEAGCNEKVLKWARVPVTDENVFALYPPMAVFEHAASMLCA